jgi:hypothetical protein
MTTPTTCENHATSTSISERCRTTDQALAPSDRLDMPANAKNTATFGASNLICR